LVNFIPTLTQEFQISSIIQHEPATSLQGFKLFVGWMGGWVDGLKINATHTIFQFGNYGGPQ
jgi:hypothetical protein